VSKARGCYGKSDGREISFSPRGNDMRRPTRPLILAVLVALSPLALDGCVSVGVDRKLLPPSEEANPATGSVEVLVFETAGDRDAFRLVPYPVLSEISRVEKSGQSLVGRSMSAMWAVNDLTPGRYRVSVRKRITPEGDIEPLKDPQGRTFEVVAGQESTLRIVLKKIPTGWIVLGAIAAAALIYFTVDAASHGKLPPLPPIPPDVVVGVVLMATSGTQQRGPAPAAADVFPAPGSVVAARKVTVNFLLATPLAPDGIEHDAVLALGTLSGELPGTIAYQPEDQLLRVTPSRDFTPGETVTVTLDLEKVRALGGRSGEGKVSTTFRVAK
jgi:hypothetical protein